MQTSQELIENFVQYLRRKNKSHSTIIAYKKDLEQLASLNVRKNLTEYTVDDIKNGLNYLRTDKGLTLKTVSRKLNSIRTFYKYLEAKNLIKDNPSKNVTHPKFPLKKQRVLSEMECLALKEVSRDNARLYAMIELLLQTGIRISELSNLNLKDVQNKIGEHYLHVEKYSNNPERRVPLNDKINKILASYIDSLPRKTQTSPLFPTRSGKNMEIRNIRSSIDRAIIKAKVKNACVNDIRNTFIVRQLENGMSISKLAEIVGHRNILTTQKYIRLLSKKYKPTGIDKVCEL